MKYKTTGKRLVVFGVMVGWQQGGCAMTEWVALFLPQLALPCPASLPASWLHPVLPSQILQLTCTLGKGNLTMSRLTLPCISGCILVHVSGAGNCHLSPAWWQRCCWWPVSRSCTGFPRMLLQSLHQPASFLTTCISSENPLDCIGHDWSL